MKVVDIHTHAATPDPEVIQVVNKYPWEDITESPTIQSYSVGIHPWFILEQDWKSQVAQLQKALSNTRVIAIGETGLDALKGPDMNLQEELFKQHIKLSEEHQIPLIIHCVKKYSDILTIRHQLKARQPWIMHGFNSSLQMMQQLVSMGIYISMGPRVMKNQIKLLAVCKEIPDDFLFVETDDTETNIHSMYDFVAKTRGISRAQLIHSIYKNFKRVFKWNG